MVQRNASSPIRLVLGPLYLCVAIVMVFYLQSQDWVQDIWLAVYPRDIRFLHGALTAPFAHGDLQHLLGNLFALFPLLIFLNYTHKRLAFQVLLLLWVLTGFLVWIFARPVFHIGASGVVYAIQVFILLTGFLKRRPRIMAIGAVCVMLFGGGFLFGLLPLQQGVSWESHLIGAITGALVALIYRNQGPSTRRKRKPHEEDDYARFGVRK